MIRFPLPEAIYLNPLPEADQDRRGLFRVARPIPVRLVWAGFDVLLGVIPEGFVTDGGSRPQKTALVFDPWGRGGVESIFHDALFYLTDWPKWLVDALYLIALRAGGVPAFEATVKYLGTRLRPRRSTDAARFHPPHLRAGFAPIVTTEATASSPLAQQRRHP